jgi:hypothetical protein
MLTVAVPKPDEVVGFDQVFPVVGGVDLNSLHEVTVQVDNGPIMRANITPITRPPMNPPRGIFTSWGEITAAPGAHIVKVAASYWNGETEKANVPVLV